MLVSFGLGLSLVMTHLARNTFQKPRSLWPKQGNLELGLWAPTSLLLDQWCRPHCGPWEPVLLTSGPAGHCSHPWDKYGENDERLAISPDAAPFLGSGLQGQGGRRYWVGSRPCLHPASGPGPARLLGGGGQSPLQSLLSSVSPGLT